MELVEDQLATALAAAPDAGAGWAMGVHAGGLVFQASGYSQRVPDLSLALAQAAIESGWGTSRFAREGNALFGQWVWGEAAKGLIPEDRQDGMNHKIRAFESPLEAVTSYIRNLNTHRAYRHMRDIRATMRSEGRMPDGHVLAEGLEAYSEKGRDYIDLVRDIIAANDLRALDHATLRNSEA